jgi:uncharacterized protein (DUF1684 family)
MGSLFSYKRLLIFFLLVAFLGEVLTGCKEQDKEPVDVSSYESQVEKWHKRRIESLTKPDGWLSLAGLFWLKEGENTFGGHESNDIKFPKDKSADFMGTIILKDTLITVKIEPGINVRHVDKVISQKVLKSDELGAPTILTYKSLMWYIIKRGDKYGVRLKDTDNPRFKEFKGIERYPVEKKWRVKATLEITDLRKFVNVPSVLGTVDKSPTPGTLVFELNGKTCRLDPIGEPMDQSYFLIFADETNGTETYGGGRFLYVDHPDSDGITYIDFNKAYNPPCVFTPYATCPLPPEQNYLPIKVTAGEKVYKGYKH